MKTYRPNEVGQFPIIEKGIVSELYLGNGTAIQVIVTDDYYFGVVGYGFYRLTHYAHESYIREKFKMLPGDATNFADFVNDQIRLSQSVRQGTYNQKQK